MVDNYEERNMIRSWISFWEEEELFYLGSWWSRSAESFPSKGSLGCPLDRLALWRLIRHDRGGSMSFHQLLQWRCSWPYSWDWAWWLIIYRMPFPIQARRIEFSVLKWSVRTVGRRIHQVISLKREWKVTSLSEANSPSRAMHKGWTSPQKTWEHHSCHQESKRVEDKITLIQSCKQREGRSHPNLNTLEASITSLISSRGFSVFLKNNWGGN